jgi:hypothetical protein
VISKTQAKHKPENASDSIQLKTVLSHLDGWTLAPSLRMHATAVSILWLAGMSHMWAGAQYAIFRWFDLLVNFYLWNVKYIVLLLSFYDHVG